MTSRFALVAAAGLLLGAYSANAADLGGGCCADLEERVAELEATTARKGNRVVSLKVYGNVNREIVAWDVENGNDDLGFGILGPNSSADDVELADGVTVSKFGLKGSATLKPGVTAGYNIEVAVSGDQGDAITLRKNNVWIENEQLGRLTLGEQSAPTDGIAHIVLANSYSDSGARFGGIYTANAAGFYTDFDGARGDFIRYDSPSIAGFILSAAWTNDDRSNTDGIEADDEQWQATLRYSGEFNAFRVAAGIGYTDFSDRDVDAVVGSASIMHVPTGLYAAVSAGENDVGAVDQDYWYVQAGIEKTWLAYGSTTFYGEYGEYDNLDFDPDTLWGLGIVQSFDSAALDIYAQYRNVEEDDNDDSISTFILGTNIKF